MATVKGITPEDMPCLTTGTGIDQMHGTLSSPITAELHDRQLPLI